MSHGHLPGHLQKESVKKLISPHKCHLHTKQYKNFSQHYSYKPPSVTRRWNASGKCIRVKWHYDVETKGHVLSLNGLN